MYLVVFPTVPMCSPLTFVLLKFILATFSTTSYQTFGGGGRGVKNHQWFSDKGIFLLQILFLKKINRQIVIEFYLFIYFAGRCHDIHGDWLHV
jgi:hypothetical protein